jgi:hypothetical protein
VESVHDIADLLRTAWEQAPQLAPVYTNQRIEMPDEKSILQFRPAIFEALYRLCLVR